MDRDESVTKELQGGKRLLLHACCAPCSLAIVERLTEDGVKPVVFFYNPNIMPKEEYEHRKEESKRHAQRYGLEWIEGTYEPQRWLELIEKEEQKSGKDLKHERERGNRCELCFEIRLRASFKVARERGIDYVATTLASSRWKDITQVNRAGEKIEQEEADGQKEINFWSRNWRKGGLQERRNELLKEGQYYNQQYCGCPYSLRKEERG